MSNLKFKVDFWKNARSAKQEVKFVVFSILWIFISIFLIFCSSFFSVLLSFHRHIKYIIINCLSRFFCFVITIKRFQMISYFFCDFFLDVGKVFHWIFLQIFFPFHTSHQFIKMLWWLFSFLHFLNIETYTTIFMSFNLIYTISSSIVVPSCLWVLSMMSSLTCALFFLVRKWRHSEE